MKKVYEAPAILVEEVCVDSLLAESLPIFGGDDNAGLDDILSKDRDNDIW